MPAWPRHDFHIHATRYRTAGSRPEMTVARAVDRARELGLTCIGVGEHQNEHPKHPLECIRRLTRELRALAPAGLHLFCGTEVDIIDEYGTVTSNADLKAELGVDYHLAAIHGVSDLDTDTFAGFIRSTHRRLMAVTTNDCVDVIAHPWTTRPGILADGIPADWPFGLIPRDVLDAWTEALAESGQAIEVSPKSRRDFDDAAFRQFIRQATQAGVRIAVGSDAHSLDALGQTHAIDGWLQSLGLSPVVLWKPGRQC